MAGLLGRKNKAELFPSADKSVEQMEMPEGIDLSALWEDPDAGGSLTTILAGAASVISLITMIIVLVKH